MNKIACIYHSIDLDGWMSAAIVKHYTVKHYWENTSNWAEAILNFIGYNYGQPIPDLSEYDRVIMCDISFPKDEMIKLWDRVGVDNMIWIDHHISAIKDIQNTKWVWYGAQDTKFAACELTWQYFFPNEPMPEIVRLLGRYDCFGHKTKSFEMSSDGYDKAKQYLKEVGQLKEFEDNHTSIDGYSLVHYANDIAKRLSEEQKVLEFQYGARQCINNYEDAYIYLLKSFDGVIEYDYVGRYTIEDKIQEQGKSIYKYLCTEAKQAYKNGFEIEFISDGADGESIFKKLKFICINKERFNPINFGTDYHKENYDGVACFWYNGNEWCFSLYNDNGKVDCSELAAQFGGGGHAGAAGFRVKDINKFLEEHKINKE